MLPVEQPFKTYTGLNGKPLDNGYVYFGLPNQDPIAHPVTVYWDAAGTLPAAQPLRTVGGYIMRAGTPANAFFGGSFSELVLDSKGRQVFYAPVSDDFSIASFVDGLRTPGGAAGIGFTPLGIGATPTNVQDALETLNQKPTGQFFKDIGARINRITDRLFVGRTATQYDGKGTPTVKSWVGTPSGGIYEYLESNATFGAYAEGSGLGMFSAARTSDTSGGSSEVSIAVASFAHNDNVGGSSGAWNFYGTALREPGTNGSTLGVELDVANLGTTVALFPGAPFQPGCTAGLWIASGGEATNDQHVGTASAALVILSNDAGLHPTVAKYDKGIVFHAKAIEGCDGVAGTGVAIAFAKGHQQMWFNNSNQAVGEIVCTNDLIASAARLDFTQFGVCIKDRATDGTQFQVQAVPGSVNYLTAVGAAAGAGAVQLNVNGADPNVDIFFQPKGTGSLRFGAHTAGALTPTGYITIKDNGGTVRRLLVG